MANAKIFAQPLQSATAPWQMVRFGEVAGVRQTPRKFFLAAHFGTKRSGFVQNENLWEDADYHQPQRVSRDLTKFPF
jgi:hypothetical protein